MTRTMYDSDVASDIPADAQLVAGYVDIWTAADWARFPNAVKVRIARNVNESGDVLDVESGDAQPSQAPSWVLWQRNSFHADPTIYVSESAWQSVRDAFAAQHVPEPHYWIASYQLPNDPSIPAGAIAHQYASPSYGSGGHWDLSNVVDYWPGVDPEPQPPPPLEEESVSLVIIATQNPQGQSTGAYLVDSATGAAAGIAADAAPQLPHVTMTDDEYNAFVSQAAKAATTGA